MRTKDGSSIKLAPVAGLLLTLSVDPVHAGPGGASLVSRTISDPSIVVREAPRPRGPRSMTGLVIIPSFGKSITSNPSGGAIMNGIYAAIQALESRVTDPITVHIRFENMSGGLGQSVTYIGFLPYATLLSHLAARATTADDMTAVALLPAGPANPVNGNADVFGSLPQLRALGFSADPPAGQPDGTIGLNTALCNLDRIAIDPSKYDLIGVALHEMDEVLGMMSALNGSHNGGPVPTGPVTTEDFFRYDDAGNRSFHTQLDSTPGLEAFFSIDGTTALARFNQTEGADFQDWFSTGPHTPQVQDAFGTPGAVDDLGVELTVLDVIGYTLGTPTPPPLSDDGGFMPPDATTSRCELNVAKNAGAFSACIETCHKRAGSAAFAGATFDEDACELTCRTRYDAKQAQVLASGTCPACLDGTHQTAVADRIEAGLAAQNGGVYCAGTVPLSGDDTGFVPPDADALACESIVAKNLLALRKCIRTCHQKAVAAAVKGKVFDEEGCESDDLARSCRAKYDAQTAKLVGKGICPPCLGSAQQAAVAGLPEADLDAENALLFCAGTVPLPPPY